MSQEEGMEWRARREERGLFFLGRTLSPLKSITKYHDAKGAWTRSLNLECCCAIKCWALLFEKNICFSI